MKATEEHRQAFIQAARAGLEAYVSSPSNMPDFIRDDVGLHLRREARDNGYVFKRDGMSLYYGHCVCPHTQGTVEYHVEIMPPKALRHNYREVKEACGVEKLPDDQWTPYVVGPKGRVKLKAVKDLADVPEVIAEHIYGPVEPTFI